MHGCVGGAMMSVEVYNGELCTIVLAACEVCNEVLCNGVLAAQ